MQRTLRLLFVATLVGSVLAASLGAIPRAWAADGTAEPQIKTPGGVGDYLRRAHDHIHTRWAEGFLKAAPAASASTPATATANLPREVAVSLTIRWDGTVAEAAVRSSSGSTEFDQAAVAALRKSAPYPLPTSDVLSDDGYAHLDWTLARDSRACAAGAKLVRVEDPIAVSLPRLILGNRIDEALRRIAEAGKDGGENSLDRFARLYLGRSVPDPLLDVAASVALAETGDKVQIARLKLALSSRATVALAAKGLQKLGVDICEAVREPLEGSVALARQTAFEAVQAAVASGAGIAACRPPLEALVKDGKQPGAARLTALDILVKNFPEGVRGLVPGLMADKDPGVRGAATLASVKKGGGRPEMYRLAPLLHDKAVEVRGAASAGIVRAAGDLALDQLYLLARETDPRPARAVAAELAELSTAPSAEFLGHMMKRADREVQLAAARALAARTDGAARAQLDAMRTSADASPELLAIASGQAGAPAPRGEAAPADSGIAPLHEMLKARRMREAAGWIVERFPSLAPMEAIDALGFWLVRETAAAEAVPGRDQPAAPGAEAAPNAAL